MFYVNHRALGYLLIERKLSISDFAAKAGLSVTSCVAMLKRNKRCHYQTIIKVCTALSVSPHRILI